jgi:hypothetical protein
MVIGGVVGVAVVFVVFVVFVVVTAALAFSVDVRFEKLFRSARCGRAIARPVFDFSPCEVIWCPFAPTGPIPTVTASEPAASAPINAISRLFMPSLSIAMPVTLDTEDRDVQHHGGFKVQGRGALVASWLRFTMPEQFLRDLDLQLVLVVLVDFDRGITRQPDQLGIVGQVTPGISRKRPVLGGMVEVP